MKTLALIIGILFTQGEEIKFNQLIESGVVIPNNDNEWDKTSRPTYTIVVSDSTVIEYAYKGEVKQWIRTGNFEYNDFLID